MHDSFLGLLRCPLCGGNLNTSVSGQADDEPEYSVLTCYCGQYPVVAGIPILKKGVIGVAARTADEVIAFIKAGRHHEALYSLLSPISPPLAPVWIRSLPMVKRIGLLNRLAHQLGMREWQEQTRALLKNPGAQVTACHLLELYCCRSGLAMKTAYDYFAYRFGQPRHLVALSFVSLIHRPNRPILDLACGFGHMTRNLIQRAKEQPVVGADREFFPLYVAKNWIAPEAWYVCCEANASLPFPDGTFSVTFCSDALQEFSNKITSIRELKRLTQDGGIIMLVALRNALLDHLFACRMLPPEGYQALVADMPHCLVADSDILARYLRRQGPSLTCSADIGYLRTKQWLSVVASHRQDIFQDYGPFEEWPHAEGHVRLNPLYVEERLDRCGNVHLRRKFPNTFYEEDHVEYKRYLPEVVEVHSEVLDDLAHGQRTPEVERLIDQLVVLGMPERYGDPRGRVYDG